MDGRQAPAGRRGAEEITASLRIRPALPEDGDALIALDSVAATDTSRRDDIGRWLASGWVFLAERDGAVRGYGTVHNHFFGREFLEMLMVDRACRGQGVGTALIRHALQACRTDTLWTSTNQSNLPMQALLAKTGFMRSGLIHGLDADDPEIVFRAEVRR